MFLLYHGCLSFKQRYYDFQTGLIYVKKPDETLILESDVEVEPHSSAITETNSSKTVSHKNNAEQPNNGDDR